MLLFLSGLLMSFMELAFWALLFRWGRGGSLFLFLGLFCVVDFMVQLRLDLF